MGAEGGNFEKLIFYYLLPRNFISPKSKFYASFKKWKGNEINTTQPLSSHKRNISKQQQPAACPASFSPGSPKTPADQGAGFFQN